MTWYKENVKPWWCKNKHSQRAVSLDSATAGAGWKARISVKVSSGVKEGIEGTEMREKKTGYFLMLQNKLCNI